ncbi:hypothetical protein KVR01_013181 [Diaporthe batatas]|uniref:uncharacterized protein n=1 Tax=Diaporthe batatas TaxID=748121 RepID=UPI001D037B55|nr:uncharacterized protein KVR01_013181 [Diaporthe batatas]KAG8156959.1 hypothetical protein KVR01_013181 [Diaporthe batatas]
MAHAHGYQDLPYEQRWEYLKPTIVRIYLDDDAKLEQLSKRMIDEFNFNAQCVISMHRLHIPVTGKRPAYICSLPESGVTDRASFDNCSVHQYRYHFKKWGIKKRTTTAEKEAVITALGKRRRQGMGTSDVQIEQGGSSKAVDKKQLKRHINDSIRKHNIDPLRPRTFLSHNLPYAALIRSITRHPHDNPSPLSNGPRTPAYLTVSSPQNQGSPQDALSPTTQLLQKRVLIDRSKLLLSGRELELMKQMSVDEKRITANWLHDFRMFSFVTAKYWGKGPKDWTSSLINAKTRALPPRYASQSRLLDAVQSPSVAGDVFDPPTQLCNWSIHYVERMDYEEIPSQSVSGDDDSVQDIEDESTWKDWDSPDERDLTATMTAGLRSNTFTKYQIDQLPLDLGCITNAVSRSPGNAAVEAIGFAIMTRNVDVLGDCLDSENYDRESLRRIYPFHLAAKFLGGSKACCGVMNMLVQLLDDENSIGVNNTDEAGMTVLDTLFTSILRSHTSVTPSVLGDTFVASGRGLEGGDVDICGRWDADSPCIRHHHATGETTIPHDWKHMFCHTSVQAVCHCIGAMFKGEWAPGINTVSGLFQKRCRSCGLELKVGTIHTFVLVCFHLANSARPGETLFGMLACLVCLLTYGADPALSAEISIPAVFGLDETEECQHQHLNAAELASAVPDSVVDSWTPQVKLGWEAVKEVLEHRVAYVQGLAAEAPHRPPNPFHDTEGALHGSEVPHISCRRYLHGWGFDRQKSLCGDTRLGMIWAAIQVELLTYRRLREGDPWLSWMFEMRHVVEGLRDRDDSILRQLVEERGQNAIQRFTSCGLFLDARNSARVTREEACTFYFANLDDWTRTTFI